MAASSPPSGWTSDATWGTDWSLDETGGYLSPRALLLGGSASAVTVYSPWFNMNNSTQYNAYAQWKSDSTTAGHNVTVELIQYQDDRVTVAATTTLHATAVAGGVTWTVDGDIFTSNGSAAWGRFKFTKAAASFNLRIDQVSITKVIPNINYELSAPWAYLTASGWDDIPFDTPSPQNLISVGSGNVTILYPDLYHVTAVALVTLDADFEIFTIRIRVDSGGLGVYSYYSGTIFHATSNASVTPENYRATVTAQIQLETDDVVDIQVFSDANQSISSSDTRFQVCSARGID